MSASAHGRRGFLCCRRRSLQGSQQPSPDPEEQHLTADREDGKEAGAEGPSAAGRAAAEKRLEQLQQQKVTKAASVAAKRLGDLKQGEEARQNEQAGETAEQAAEDAVVEEIDGCVFGKPRGPPKKSQQQTLREILKRADGFLAAGAWENAIKEYDAAVTLAPKDWRGHRGKAMAWQGLGNHLRAYSACKRGLEQLPNNAGLNELAERCRTKYQDKKKEDEQAREAREVPDGKRTLSKEEAKEFLDFAIEEFDKPGNITKLKAIAAEVQDAGDDIMARQSIMQTKLLPEVLETLGPKLKAYDLGIDDTMGAMLEAMMQVQFYAAGDKDMQPKVQRVMDFVMTGKLEQQHKEF